MPPVSVLLKPSSSACNMACTYCFYRDVSQHREQVFEGMLSLEDMEKVILAAMERAEGTCSFAFQGGEPTLAGLDFFRQAGAGKKALQARSDGLQFHSDQRPVSGRGMGRVFGGGAFSGGPLSGWPGRAP